MIEFDKAFEALTSHYPMRWQARLFSRLRSGVEIPPACDIPTGLGKTSVIPIWLIAVAQQAEKGRVSLPRRLVYIVNRRTVVDQASNVVMGIRERLMEPCKSEWAEHESTLNSLAGSLRKLTSRSPLVGISTLRGELADNEEWKDDPARAAIVVGTIDMVGSKLLFSGYGDGPYKRAHHAGLIGQDTMFVHDESHLTPAFSDLIRRVEEIQVSDHEPRPIRVMELSATQRSSGAEDVFQLEDGDLEPMVLARLDAHKCLLLHSPKGKQVQQLVDLAHEHDRFQAKVLVYVRSPEDAQLVSDGLRNKLGTDPFNRVALLTGTMRGRERDRLVTEQLVYAQMFNPDARPDETVYLVSTSAGEVGIDIDADHMVCDLTTLDSMIQRLGRVNRRGGERRNARVDVVWTDKDEDPKNEVGKSVAKTLQIFKEWAESGTIDASARNVLKRIQELSDEDYGRAFSPKPAVPPLTDILLDAWALTSIDDMPGRPDVAPYLHGQTNDPPETYIAWRNEVSLFERHCIDDSQLHSWFRSCRIRSDERLSDRTDSVKTFLRSLHSEHKKRRENDGNFAVVMLSERGKVEMLRLADVVERSIEYATLVLPVEAGGLDPNGMLDHTKIEPVQDIDVADAIDGDLRRERWLCRSGETQEWKRLLSGESKWSELEPDGWSERTRIELENSEESDEGLYLVLRMPGKQLAAEDPGIAAFRQTLAEHKKRIGCHMESIADRLGLEPHIGSALVSAAIRHDDGKDRRIWQHYARNDDIEPLAKSERYRRPSELGGYRHELGSMLDAMRDDSLVNAEERELVLHVIAAHHGHARPYFPDRGFDNERFGTLENQQAAIEVMQRFGRLQDRFGRWGLVWLESLMRCADVAASQPDS